MDDELEDEVMYHTLISHLNILSRFVTVSLNNRTLRYVGRWLMKPEALALALVALALLFFCQSADIWYRKVLTRLLPSAKGLGPSSLLLRAVGDPGKVWQLEDKTTSVFAIQGRRPRMEDRFSVLDESSIYLYGIFDGHGGESAAEFVEKSLFKTMIKKLQEAKMNYNNENSAFQCDQRTETKCSVANENNQSVEERGIRNEQTCSYSEKPQPLTSLFSKLLTEEILSVDKKFMQLAKQVNDLAGTTALVAIVHEKQLIVANVGDSRGVICDSKGAAIPLSFDHKPQQVKERRRIREAGGFITFHGVWRVVGILATSRALGDFPLKDRNLIIAEPDILAFDLSDLKPQFMILATDGLWDEFSNEEAVAYIREHFNESHHGAKSLALEAHRRGSVDNITIMIVTFLT